MHNEGNELIIPFGKAARVGNFKLWRSRITVGGLGKKAIEAVNVSSIDGSWKVQIPSTSQMFSTVCNGYATIDKDIRDSFLGMLFGNIYNVSTCPSEALHDAFFFLTEMMTFPYMLLSEKEMVSRMEKGMKEAGTDKAKRKEHIAKMVDYRRQLYELIGRKKDAYIAEYERQQAERRAQEPEAQKAMEQDALAEQAMEILNEKGDEDTN